MATLAPLPLTPENWMNDKLTRLLGNDRHAVDWTHKIMSLANLSPLGIPQAGYDAGQLLGRGAQQVQGGNTWGGLAQAGLGGLMGAMAIGPGKFASEEAAPLINEFRGGRYYKQGPNQLAGQAQDYLPSSQLVPARIHPVHGLIVGEPGMTHGDLFSEDEIEKLGLEEEGATHEQPNLGYYTPDGRYLTREDALKYLNQEAKKPK